jgi:outer membrane protein
MELASTRRAYLPRLDASARMYWDDADFSYDGDKTNWTAGIALRWGLLGGGRGARVAKARAVLAEMIQTDRKATLAVQLDVKTAYIRIDEARARVKVTEASVMQATETLTLVRNQYDGGTVPVTRYLEVEMMLTRARMRNTNAAYDLKKSLADAARAMGWLGSKRSQKGLDHGN